MFIGPRTEAADRLHAMKYRQPGEDFREAMNRIAFGLKDNDQHYHDLRDVLLHMRFMPAGRVQSAIGAARAVTAYNCFVSGTIADSYVDGPGSIMARAHEAAATMRMGGGIGYDFSTLRPRGDLIRKLQSTSTGPCSFMRIFNEVCLCTCSSGHRRGAQMAVLRVDHPDIVEYVRLKHNEDQFTGFNLSVAVTDEFMEAALAGKSFPLRFNGQTYREVDASELWEMIMRSTWDWGEPGVIFIDTVNRLNNLRYCETIAATNPCAEQCLPPYGACLLGSFNLTRYLVRSGPVPAGEPNWVIDLDRLREDIPIVVRAMDNVVDRSLYPLAEQRAEAVTKRRMGLGVTGLANTLEATGHPYGSIPFLAAEDEILSLIAAECYRASAMLAKEKGTFPMFDTERYMASEYLKWMPDDVLDMIRRHGLRNSHLTSQAPTGTISLCADNVSGSTEPVYKHRFDRPIFTPSGVSVENLEDYGVAFLGHTGRESAEVSAAEHLAVLITAQHRTDSAVSKTVNMDGEKMQWSQFKDVYRLAWEGGAKSCATMNASGKRASLFREREDGDGAACAIDPITGRMECA